MRHELNLDRVPFDKIASGKKTVESRLYDEKRRCIAVGDELMFSLRDDPTQTVTASVVALHRHSDFTALMTSLPTEKFGWGTSAEAVEAIGRFYSQEDVAANGVVGIEIALVP